MAPVGAIAGAWQRRDEPDCRKIPITLTDHGPILKEEIACLRQSGFGGPLQPPVVTSEACASLSREVSNRGMRQMILSFWALLLTVCSWPQPSSTNKTEKAAIRRAKSLIVSSFDRSLPNVSLEFFLKNEGGGDRSSGK